MPKGPQGQKRPADAIGAAIRVARIATGEEPEDRRPTKTELAQKAAKARSDKLAPKERSRIAQKAAKSRWEARETEPGKA